MDALLILAGLMLMLLGLIWLIWLIGLIRGSRIPFQAK